MSHLPQIELFEEFDENDLGMYTYALKYCAEIAVAKGSCPKCNFTTNDIREMMIHFLDSHSFSGRN